MNQNLFQIHYRSREQYFQISNYTHCNFGVVIQFFLKKSDMVYKA